MHTHITMPSVNRYGIRLIVTGVCIFVCKDVSAAY